MHTLCMGILIILFVLLVGPAALLWGVDSRVDEIDRRRRGV
jgi:hypothetical protein